MSEFEHFFPISAEQISLIRKSIGKSDADIKGDVQLLREWLKKQPQIPDIKDDKFLEVTLVRNKGRIEKSKLKIDKYFSAKSAFTDYFDQLDPSSQGQLNVRKYVFWCPMPKLAPNMERIVYVKLLDRTDIPYVFKDYMNMYGMLSELRFRHDYTSSEIAIFDMENYGLNYIKKVDSAALAKVIHLYLECFSGRYSSIHVVNGGAFVEIVMAIFKPILPSKVFSKMFVHKTLDDFYKHLPKEYLPKELEGTSGVSAREVMDNLSQCLMTNRDAILECNRLGTNEKLRIGKPVIESELFGVDGTFKSLNLD